MKKILLLLSLAAMVACRGNVGGHHHHEDEDGHSHGSGDEIVIEPEKAEKLGIESIKVEKTPLSGVIKTSGKIVNGTGSCWDIVAVCSGKITFLKENLACGSEVRQSENLFAVSSREMNMQNNAAELEKSKARLEHAEKEYERAKHLREERLVTESELLLAKREYSTAKTEYMKMNNSVDRKLASPASGFITAMNVQNGQYVEEGTTIATVATGKDIIVEAQLPARYSSKIGSIIGANFNSGFGGKVFAAEKLISSSDITQSNGTFIPVRFKVVKSEGITVGMPVEVFIKISDGRDVIAVPKDAVSERFGKYFVYRRLDEDCYQEIEVTLGECDGLLVEIKSGIEDGDEIVTKGVYYVKMAGNGSSIPHGHSH